MAESLDRVVVFAGPSLPRRPDSAWKSLLDRCDLRPPAQRGDVLAALSGDPRTIVLLDGYYFTVPSVTHKELLYALDAGVRVIGAASLGALRAAEMAPFGMVGVGRVYEAYASGALDGDDEVALLHAPAENGYRGITVALVELRHAVERLVKAGAVGEDAGRELIAAVKATSFLDRYPDRIAELSRRHLGEGPARELAALLAAGGLKAEDARAALELALTEESQRRAVRRRPPTGFLHSYREAYLRCSPEGPTLHAAWRMAQLFHPDAADFVRRVRVRALRVAAAVRAGLEPDAEEVSRRAGELRQRHIEAFGAPVLPGLEYLEEARFEALEAVAVRLLGGEAGALASLARHLRLPAGTGEDSLLAFFGVEAVPAWWTVRAFTATPAFPAAVAAARAAGEVHRCFLRWADGARVAMDDLARLAAGLWGCEPEAVNDEAARRGLYPATALTEGLREALEGVAAAERLPRPINDYPRLRDELREAPLQGAFAAAKIEFSASTRSGRLSG